jgi:hypothetical protein
MSIRRAKKRWKRWMRSQGFVVRRCYGEDFGFIYSDKDVRRV